MISENTKGIPQNTFEATVLGTPRARLEVFVRSVGPTLGSVFDILISSYTAA